MGLLLSSFKAAIWPSGKVRAIGMPKLSFLKLSISFYGLMRRSMTCLAVCSVKLKTYGLTGNDDKEKLFYFLRILCVTCGSTCLYYAFLGLQRWFFGTNWVWGTMPQFHFFAIFINIYKLIYLNIIVYSIFDS